MSHEIQLIIALAAPFLILTVLRINAAMAFLSLCLGYTLLELVAKDASSLITFLAPTAGSISQVSWQLGTLFAPVVLTCIIMVFSIKGHIRVAINALPAAATSVMAVLLAVPLLSPGLRYALQSETLWRTISRSQAVIVGGGAAISLIFLWTQRRHAKKSER
jgi:hypothetical protein